jgi:adenylate cyclase
MDIYELGPFRLDTHNDVLLQGSEPVMLGGRAVALLRALVERPGALVSKDALIEAAWPGQAVEDSNLPVQIAALRRALGEAPGGDRWIETMPRRGYRFVGPVVAGEVNSVTAAPPQVDAPRDAAPIRHDEAERRQITALSCELVGVVAGAGGTGLEDLREAVGAFQQSSRPSWRGRVIVGMAAAATLVIVCLVWWLWPASNFFSRAGKPAEQATGSIMSAATTPTAAAISAPLVAPRLSIVVLPFANLSNDPDQQYFADGITENLTTDLSRLSPAGPMFVISSNSAFTYQGKRVDTKQIGRELGVRYVLQGSVERSGNRVRLNAQLIDAETDADLWAERFDGDTSDLFALQDEVTRRIAISLKLELIAAEAARPTRNPDALDLVLRARSMYLRPMSRNRDDEVIGLFQRAVELDPGFVEAQFRLAGALANRQLDGFGSSVADIKRAEALSLQALAAATRNPVAHSARAQVLRAQGRLDEAISEYEIAVASDRNNVVALANMGRCKILIGQIEDGISAQLQAIRLSPRDPAIGSKYFRIGQARLLQSRFEEAIRWLEKARDALPELAVNHADLAAAYALHGDAEQAAAELTEAQRLDANYSSIARLKPTLFRGQIRGARPEIRALFETTYLAGLRKAGMPEE